MAGFSDVMIELGLNRIMNNYSARIESNPQLSDCRAQGGIGPLPVPAFTGPSRL